MTDVYKFIENLKIKSKYVVAAISGGPDSMYLLNVLLNLREKFKYKIVVAHIHHNLRNAFLDIAKNEPARCVVINANQTAEQVHADIVKAISERLLQC